MYYVHMCNLQSSKVVFDRICIFCQPLQHFLLKALVSLAPKGNSWHHPLPVPLPSADLLRHSFGGLPGRVIGSVGNIDSGRAATGSVTLGAAGAVRSAKRRWFCATAAWKRRTSALCSDSKEASPSRSGEASKAAPVMGSVSIGAGVLGGFWDGFNGLTNGEHNGLVW